MNIESWFYNIVQVLKTKVVWTDKVPMVIPKQPSESVKEIVAAEEGGKAQVPKGVRGGQRVNGKLKMGTVNVVQRNERQLKELSTLNEGTKVWNYCRSNGITVTMITSYLTVPCLF